MSLDVWLTLECSVTVNAKEKIVIREDGSNKEITRDEWNLRFPDREPFVIQRDGLNRHEVYSANITHNLGRMADEAGIYQCLWRPEEVDILQANQLVEPLTDGLKKLRNNPEHFKQFNPSNGWGTYEGLIEFVRCYLDACISFPEAAVNISR